VVTVAVVSWNTRDLLLRCLASLAPEVTAGRARVWVVDNGSSDGSVDAARSVAPWATMLCADQNLGFGRAVNLVARRDEMSEWLLAANADIALEPGALSCMLAAGEAPDVGCVAPRLVLPDGRTQHSVFPFPTVPFTLAFNLGLHRLSPRAADRWCLEGFWDPERSRRVPWAIGACLLLRRSAFAAVGGFDDHRWLFAEDLDLGWRLRQHGWATRYEPSARVLHQGSAATDRAFGGARRERFMAATYATLAVRRGAARMRVTGAVNVLGAAARAVWLAGLAAFSARREAQRDDALAWLRAHVNGIRQATSLDTPR
jgi:N-acetylglucosaminyl-diphospho-decaprenol L-rhamnosyltransferase